MVIDAVFEGRPLPRLRLPGSRAGRRAIMPRCTSALDQLRLYQACYGLPIVTAIKLLWDGVSGYLR